MRKIIASLLTASALLTATTVNAAQEKDSKVFEIDGCTPGDISLTLPEQFATIPTDQLVNSSTITLIVPFEVIEMGECSIARGLTVQVDRISNIPSYLQLTSSDEDRVFADMLFSGEPTQGEFQLTFEVVEEVPANDQLLIGMDIGAYSLLASEEHTVGAGELEQDSFFQETFGSPVAPKPVAPPQYQQQLNDR